MNRIKQSILLGTIVWSGVIGSPRVLGADWAVLFYPQTPAPGIEPLTTLASTWQNIWVGPTQIGWGAFFGVGGTDGAAWTADEFTPTLRIRYRDPALPGARTYYGLDTLGGVADWAGNAVLAVKVRDDTMATQSAIAALTKNDLHLLVWPSMPSPWVGRTMIVQSSVNSLVGNTLAQTTVAVSASSAIDSRPGIVGISLKGVSPIMLVGEPAPGGASDAVFVEATPSPIPRIPLATYGITDDGRALLYAVATFGPGIWISAPIDPPQRAALSLVARNLQPAPGLLNGELLQVPFSTGGASGDQIAFVAALVGAGVTSSNDRVLYAGRPESILPVLREGESMPGLPSNVILNDFKVLDARNGRMLVSLSLRGPTVGVNYDDLAYAVIDNGRARLIMRNNDAEPGRLGTPIGNSATTDATLDYAGRLIVVTKTVVGGRRLWLMRSPTDGQMMLKVGDDLTVSPGVTRKITGLSLASSNGRSSVTADGRLVVLVGLSNTITSIIATRLPAPPCPCPADFDGSGGTPSSTDISAFFTAWLFGNATADADCSGGTPDTQDIETFFVAWLAGGC
jgi:hypothetical protein